MSKFVNYIDKSGNIKRYRFISLYTAIYMQQFIEYKWGFVSWIDDAKK